MAKPKPTKLAVCMSCGRDVDWRHNDSTRTWEPFDAGTNKPHKCVEVQP